MAKNDPIFITFEMSTIFCQKATNLPPKKFYCLNWPKICYSLAHLLSKNWLIYYGKIFWNFFCQIFPNFSWNFIKLLNLNGCAGNWQFQASYIIKWNSGPVIFFGKWHSANYYFGHAIWQKKNFENFLLNKNGSLLVNFGQK